MRGSGIDFASKPEGASLEPFSQNTKAASVPKKKLRHVPAPGISAVVTTESGLPYLRRFGGSAGARLGFDRYALAARYRLSPAFAAGYAAWPELPRWVLGVEVGLF